MNIVGDNYMDYRELALELKLLKTVDKDAAREYSEKSNILIQAMEDAIYKKIVYGQPNRKLLYKVMSEAQAAHIDLMINIFRLNAYEALIRIIHWLDKVRYVNGLHSDIPIRINKLWIEVIEETLSSKSASVIVPIYQWIVNNYERIIAVNIPRPAYCYELEESLDRVREDFLVYLIIGDFSKCLSIASQLVDSPDNLLDFYVQIVQPTIYEIQNMWEDGELTMAQEQAASSMIARIIPYFETKAIKTQNAGGRVAVINIASEYYDLDSRMVADFFRLYGWQVSYFTTSVSGDGLINAMKNTEPQVIAISITMFQNIGYAEDLIKIIRNAEETCGLKIIVGGQAFDMEAAVWGPLGADGYYGSDFKKAVLLAEEIVKK